MVLNISAQNDQFGPCFQTICFLWLWFYFIFSTLQKQPPQVFFKKRSETLLKKTLWHRSFPVNFAKFLKRCFLQNQLQNTSRRLLLYLLSVTATTVNISNVCISFKFKRFQRICIWYLISTTLSLVLFFFFFSCLFCLSQFCFIFSCRC